MSNANKTVFITGGAQRIGKAIALHLAQQGYNIAIHYHRSQHAAHDTVAELSALGVKAVCVQADFSSALNAPALFDQAQQSLGPIGCLINSAASFHKDTLPNPPSMTQFDDHMHVNLLAPLMLIQAFAQQAKTHGLTDASIINLGDGAYGWSNGSNYLSYALSKRGLMALADLLALELAPQIRINSIGLGPTLTGAQDNDDTFERLRQRTPLQRLSNPDEVCRTIDYLLQTRSITGQQILLSSGFHCHQPIDLP